MTARLDEEGPPRRSRAAAFMAGVFTAALPGVAHAAPAGGGGRGEGALTFIERPARPEAGGKPPLLLLMHGLGADERDLEPLARKVDARFLVVLPRGPVSPPQGGRAWFNVTFAPDGRRVVSADDAERSRRALLALIDRLVRTRGVDPRRVVLAGFSQGGIMATALALSAPARVAGAACLSGRVLRELEPHWAPPAKLRGVPILMVHGSGDDMIPVAWARESRDLLQARGADVTWLELPMGHGISPEAEATLLDWLRARLDRPR